jgi:hypothetical protein
MQARGAELGSRNIMSIRWIALLLVTSLLILNIVSVARPGNMPFTEAGSFPCMAEMSGIWMASFQADGASGRLRNGGQCSLKVGRFAKVSASAHHRSG